MKIGLVWKAWTLARQIVPRRAKDGNMRAAWAARSNEQGSLGTAAALPTMPAPIQSSASRSSEPPGYELDAGHPARSQREAFGDSAGTNASVDALAERLYSVVETVSAQQAEIEALRARCQQLEEHDQAIAVAFTTFFHVLAAKRIARLEDICAVLQSIITTAEREAHPQESIHFLQRLATMLQEPSGAGAAEEPVNGLQPSETGAASA